MLKLMKMPPTSSPSTRAIIQQHALATGRRNLPLISLVQASTSRVIRSQVRLVEVVLLSRRRHLVFKEAHPCLIVVLERMMVVVLGDHADGSLRVDSRCQKRRLITSGSWSDRGATSDVKVAADTAHCHALIQAVLRRVGLLRLQLAHHLVIETATRADLNACARPNVIELLLFQHA